MSGAQNQKQRQCSLAAEMLVQKKWTAVLSDNQPKEAPVICDQEMEKIINCRLD